MFTKSFGDVVREQRRLLKIPLKELAGCVDLSVVYVSKIERGERNPPDEDIVRIWGKRFDFSDDEIEEFVECSYRSRRTIEIETKDKKKEIVDLALAFSRRVEGGDISTETAAELFKILKKD